MKVNSYLILLIVFVCNFIASAQSERKIARKGNMQYETGNFAEAEVNYKKAIEKNANLLEAQFNLGDALAKQERFEEAIASFDLVSATSEDDDLKASALHNKGNVLLQQQDIEGAVESYKKALRVNPKDHQTRYNYAFAKKQLEQQQQQEQEQEQNDENQDEENKEDKKQDQENKEKGDQKNEDSENQENKDEENQDKKEDKKEQGENKENESDKEEQDKGETDGEDSDDEKNEKPAKPKENKLSPEEAQRLLEALKQEENKVQAKMKKHKIKGSKVKIEKDW